MTEQNTFSTILTRAITTSGLSLTTIVDKMNEQGLRLSAATLSYWKTGKSLPTRKSSLPILKALEEMCSLPAGTLLNAAKNDMQVKNTRQKLATPKRNHIPDNVHSQVPSDSADLEAEIQWEYEAEREILIDSFHVSADFQTIRSEMTILARIVNPSHSHLHVSSYLSTEEGEFDNNETGLRYIEGATIGEIFRHENSRALTLRLDLPKESKVGDLRRVFYLPTPFQPSEPCTTSPIRYFAWPLRMYNCNVFFEGDVPENIEWITEGTEQTDGSRIKQITSKPVRTEGNAVQISLENVQGIMGYFRWG